MNKRIIAWILLIGFVALIVNITFIQKYLEISISIYVIILVYFLLTGGIRKKDS